jgi:pantoate--beta-alanine ligase
MSLAVLSSPAQASRWCAQQRARGASLGFVPTMGALHPGHLSLVERARSENDLVCVSVFVNPLQFDEPGDLASYPRDWQSDARLLDSAACDMVFTGTLAEFFEGDLDAQGRLAPGRLVDPGPGARGLEGACRRGHFEGVATIVERLFELVSPDRAYFGQKDFQQTLVVRELARRRGGPQIVVCPISREASGLARSSRNERLDAAARARATCLSRALARGAQAWRAGERDAARLEEAMGHELELPGVEVEYATVRDPQRWSAERPAGSLDEAVGLLAVRLGQVRLIDNHLLSEALPLAEVGSVPAAGPPSTPR